MIRVGDICRYLEELAPLSLQESYDNSGLQLGDRQMEVRGLLVALDVTEEVILEAEKLGYNMLLSHHPVIFGGVKSLTGSNMTQRVIQLAIQKQMAIYSAHTNFDAIPQGVNAAIATRLGLVDTRILDPVSGQLKKLVVFVPRQQATRVREALFQAGAGHIGNYDSCSFNLEGQGTFRGGEGSDPFVGSPGELHQESEVRIETVLPASHISQVVAAMLEAHPYEEVAYDLYPLENAYYGAGMGLIGKLEEAMEEQAFLHLVKEEFNCGVIRHTALLGRVLRRVAICGGSGSFLIGRARAAGADVFVSADLKYHQFFEADKQMLLLDMGHYESEQFTCDLFYDLIQKKFPKFAVRLSETDTNPIKYF